jgi:uncharacterized metal-binding protein YceD (DUF177 family)
MNRFSEYIIPFNSYSNGHYQFDYELDEAFFELFPENDVKQPRIRIKVDMIKQDRQLEFDFTVSGSVFLPCDRCLEEYEQPVNARYKLYGKFGSGRNDEEFDVIWIPQEAHQVDLSQYFYEYVILALPLRKVHPGGKNGKPGCNPEMLDLLDHLSITK